jgi:hypothetical protein
LSLAGRSSRVFGRRRRPSSPLRGYGAGRGARKIAEINNIMATSRDKNTPENYSLEAWRKTHTRSRIMDTTFWRQAEPMFPGGGLLPNRNRNSELSSNWTDIENLLFGISANNLVHPRPEIVPQIKQLPSLNIADRPQIPLPWGAEPLRHQRYIDEPTASEIRPRWQAF